MSSAAAADGAADGGDAALPLASLSVYIDTSLGSERRAVKTVIGEAGGKVAFFLSDSVDFVVCAPRAAFTSLLDRCADAKARLVSLEWLRAVLSGRRSLSEEDKAVARIGEATAEESAAPMALELELAVTQDAAAAAAPEKTAVMMAAEERAAQNAQRKSEWLEFIGETGDGEEWGSQGMEFSLHAAEASEDPFWQQMRKLEAEKAEAVRSWDQREKVQRRAAQREWQAKQRKEKLEKVQRALQEAQEESVRHWEQKKQVKEESRRVALRQKRAEEARVRRQKRKKARVAKALQRKREAKQKLKETNRAEYERVMAEHARMLALKKAKKEHTDNCKVYVGGIVLHDIKEWRNAQGTRLDKEEALQAMEARKSMLLGIFERYGKVRKYLLFWDEHYAFVVYQHPSQAAAAYLALKGKPGRTAVAEELKKVCSAAGQPPIVVPHATSYYVRLPKSNAHQNYSDERLAMLAREEDMEKRKRRAERGNRRVLCYRCESEGHYARSCPSKMERKPMRQP